MDLDRGPRSIETLLNRVRARWGRVLLFEAIARAALFAAGAIVLALMLARLIPTSPIFLALLGTVTVLAVAASFAWSIRSARSTPSNARVARYIEESHPELEDRLVSAIHVLEHDRAEEAQTSSNLAASLLADADRRAAAIDPGSIVADDHLRRRGFQAVAAGLAFALVAFAARDVGRQSLDALSLTLFPSRITLDVKPGHAHVEIGKPFSIDARLVGNRAPVVVQVLRADAVPDGVKLVLAEDEDSGWHATEMTSSPGGFQLKIDAVANSFKYRVVAGTVTSPVFDVTALRAPRVTRIDLEYTYPPALGLKPDSEEDTGDIYAPAGTNVRIRVHTDRPIAQGQLALTEGARISLSTVGNANAGDNIVSAQLTVAAEDSYRVALSDRNGLKNPGDTEYFIRTIEDRPPEVHVLKPARDRNVTRLEEVDIEAKAEDDYGLANLELVYAVSGRSEQVVPMKITPNATSASGAHTIYLEDLDVKPGEFVWYFVRARDIGRGRKPSEGRSDIFFLEVKPFEQEFSLAQSQAGGGGNPAMDSLIAAQKDVIVATWKLDRRSAALNGPKSDEDIRSVSRAESDLKRRVEETASSFREGNMRDPRQRLPQPGGGRNPGGAQPGGGQPGRGQTPTPPLRAGQTLPEEDAMTAAATAMGKAVTSLNGLKTSDAIPNEMDALNHLLKAQGDVKQQQIARQSGTGNTNRSTQDLSSLFDKELQHQQQTNYETPSSNKPGDNSDLADQVKELARRQDELNRQQQELGSKKDLSPADRQRELEKLARNQSDLQKQAEDLAREMEQQQSKSASGSSSGGGQSGQSGQQQMRAASDEMKTASNDLRRQDPKQAGARGARALQKLQDLERQLRSATPDDRRRALGEMQLEARQIADAERQLAEQLKDAGRGAAANDNLRRLAGEEQRLADRARRVENDLDRQAAAIAGRVSDADKSMQRALTEAARDADRQQYADRMNQAAEQVRAAAAKGDDQKAQQDEATKAAAAQEAIARDLEKLADKLASAQTPSDDESRRLADERARAQQLREEMDRIAAQIEKLGQQASQNAESAQKAPGQTGQAGRGQAGAGGGGTSDLARLREQYQQKLDETRKLLDDLRRDDPTFSQGGAGLTFEGQGMTLSAPGTEAFKQDFAKWERLRQQATQLLEHAETSLSQRLQAKIAKDRLAAGTADNAPPAYQQQVDDYFKAIATRKP